MEALELEHSQDKPSEETSQNLEEISRNFKKSQEKKIKKISEESKKSVKTKTNVRKNSEKVVSDRCFIKFY